MVNGQLLTVCLRERFIWDLYGWPSSFKNVVSPRAYSGGEEAEDEEEEEEEEEAQLPLTDKLSTSPEEKTLFSLEEQSPESKETDSLGNLNFIFFPQIF